MRGYGKLPIITPNDSNRAGKTMPDINQGVFFEKIIRLIEINSHAPISELRASKIREGLCFGFSVVHSYMAAFGKLEWWTKALERLRDWDGNEVSLSSIVNIPGSSQQGESLHSLLNRIAGYVLYNFGNEIESGIEKLNQKTFLTSGGLFFSEQGGIVKQATAAGHLDKTALERILNPEIFSQESLYIVSGFNRRHACALRFDHDHNSWCFYDPNYPQGEKHFDTVADLTVEIHRVLSPDFMINIATWNNAVNIDEFQQRRDLLIKENMTTVIKPAVLLDILKYAPDEFDAILTIAENDKEVRRYFFDSLFFVSERIDPTLFFNMEKESPARFNKIIDLALADEESGLFFIEKSFTICANNERNKISGLSIIVMNILSYPEKISQLIEIIKNDINPHHALIDFLIKKTPESEKILTIIQEQLPNEWERIDSSMKERLELENLKLRIKVKISNFAQKSPWCVEHEPALFKSASEGSEIIRSLLTKISQSKNKNEILACLQSGVVDNQPQYNAVLDGCIQLISSQTSGLRM